MRNIKDIIGKRLIFPMGTIIYKRYPNSEMQKTLPPGKPSPIIISYLMNGFFEVEGAEGSNWYIYDSGDNVQIVDPDEKGDVSIFQELAFWIYDLKEGSQKTAAYATDLGWGSLKDGIGKTTDQFSFGAQKLAKELRYMLIGIVALLIIILINKLS